MARCSRRGAALDRARSRLDYLAADPVRNAENAVKVLLKFLLLERRRLPLAEVEALCASVPLLVLARERFLHGASGDWRPGSCGRWRSARRGRRAWKAIHSSIIRARNLARSCFYHP
jgi:hypothetical protein